nr:FkbM family methyltransferase [Halorubrum sp. GN11_10-6_MGM]
MPETDGIMATAARVGDVSSSNIITIDEFAERHLSPSVVKIDVEGAELTVLDGMVDVLNQDGPDIYIEVHPQHLPIFDSSVEELISRLTEAGYTLQVGDHREKGGRWVDIEDTKLSEYDSSIPVGETGHTYTIRGVLPTVLASSQTP